MQIPKRRPGPFSHILVTRILVLAALVGALASTGLWVYLLVPADGSAKSLAVRTSVQNSPEDITATQAVATQYMNDFLNHRYHQMWSLLHPQVKTIWSNEQTFAAYWNKRFQEYNLRGFTLGQVKLLSSWVNPETMTLYSHVEQVNVSLQLELKAGLQQQGQVPPEDLHPGQLFQNLPFIVQHVTDQNSTNGRWLVLNGGPADLEAPILPPITAVVTTVQVPILMYHHISDVPTRNVLDKSLTVTSTMFGSQLDYLKTQGYHMITFNQLFAALYYNGPLPTKPVILTFDDGYDDAYRFAYPILREHGFSGMFYIITGKVGWQGQMTWAQMREMLAHGMQMGSHTIHHVDMGRVFLISPEQAQQEVQLSQSVMQRQLGVAIQQFCYPSGEPFHHGSWALRHSVTQLLAANGYVGATTDPGMTGIQQESQSPFVLLRLRVDGRELLQNFMNGLL